MEFYLLSDQEKINMATYVINNNNWKLDKEEGGSQGTDPCVVCNETKNCTGHYGLLYLQTTITHPLFVGKYRKNVPKEAQMSTLLIPPPGLRSSDNIEWKDKLSSLYYDLIEIIKKEKFSLLQEKVNEIFGSKTKTGIMEYLSSKDGIFRKIVYGKRLESSGRSVITGDPCIDPTEIIIPKMIANNLYINCIVTDKNTTYYYRKNYEIDPSDLVIGLESIRKIKDGDLIIANRQPTLSYGSMFSFKVKIATDDIKTIRIHPNVTKTFNADFDGDEMNLFCFPDSGDLKNMFIGNFPKHINNIQDSKTRKYMKENGFIKEYPGYDELLEFDLQGLTVSLSDLSAGKFQNTGLDYMVSSKSKGNIKNVEQMITKVGKQYLSGQFIGEIDSSYLKGLNPDEFFIHQKASREGVVSTGVKTSDTGYINRKGTTLLADVVKTEKYVEDNYGIISFLN
jgi:DNA-directed RNA polymerase beta' subunit